ncbi:hypothetical protein B0H19DRAFT_1142945 [Mycena capillaripes]|nr:hypothetical protein B0H19DRAFT_1142945 [Mycena capillaripes]
MQHPSSSTTPLGPSANPSGSDAFGRSSIADPEMRITEITVEGPEDPSSHDYFRYVLESPPRDTLATEYNSMHNAEDPMVTPPRRRGEYSFTNLPPERLSGTHFLSPVPQAHAVAARTRSFTSDPSPHPFRSRTHSDTTSERPQFSLHSELLLGSAVDDAFSPSFDHSPYGSIPSSPAHSGHDPHSPMMPFVAEGFLLPPQPMYRHSNASFSSSESSFQSTEWGQSSAEMGGSFYAEHLQSDGSLHPPMLPDAFWGGDGTFLALPSPVIHRRTHASSFDGSETSSIRSPSPNPLWDHASPFGGSDLEDIGNSHDNASISPTHSSTTSRQGEDLPFLMNHRLQLQDGPPAVTGGYPASADFDSHMRGTSTEHLPCQQRPPNIIIAGPSQSFKIEDGISPSEWHGEYFEEKFRYGYWPSSQGEDPAHLLNQQPQLQDGHAVATGGYLGSQDFAMYSRGTSTERLPPHSSQQRPPDMAIASSSTEGGLSPSDEPIKKLGYRKVGTKAGRLAAADRRKDKKGRALHVCGICGQDFTAKHNLRHHIDSHNSVRPFECGKCTLRFGTKHTMTRHERKCKNGPDSKPAI